MTEKKKILVIADDFTGAAEIGGIGLRNGLKVAIETEPIFNKDMEVIIIATDTRSMSESKAAENVSEITNRLLRFDPLLIYKKIDSVFRGNISEELVAQMKEMGKKRAIIVAANPALGRIIKDGRYYIDNIPLNETCFSIDSQYPIKTNKVVELIKPIDGYPIVNLKADDPLPENGLIIGDVESIDDLHKWAQKYDNETLLAGAFGFFNSLLETLNIRGTQTENPTQTFGTSALFILGSSYPKDKDLLDKMITEGLYLSNMPEEIYKNKSYNTVLLDRWANDVITHIKENRKVIVASMHPFSEETDISFRVKNVIAKLVNKVFDEVTPNEILIEGGSTTSEVLNALNIKKLTPIQELDTGVIRMKVDRIPGLCLTTKPGSYEWPKKVWQKNGSEKRTMV